MRSLLFTDFFPASDKAEIVGGVEAFCFFISKYLKSEGNEVQVVARPISGKEWSAPNLSAVIERINFVLSSIKNNLNTNSDVIIGTNAATYFTAWLVGKLSRRPVVFWVPDVLIGNWVKLLGPVGYLGELSDKLSFSLPDVSYIAISHSTKKKIENIGIDSDLITVIPCGVDLEEVKKVSKPTKKIYDISIVCRMLKYKNVSDLIDAVSILEKQHPKIKLAIVGQGPEKNSLKNQVQKLKLSDNVVFLGHLPKHLDVLKVISQSKIFCLPSSTEGFGIVVVEASALGVPTVVSNIDALKETTNNGQSGLIFDLGNPSDLAEKIDKLLTDQKLYSSKSHQAKILAQKYSWKNIAKLTSEYLKKIISK